MNGKLYLRLVFYILGSFIILFFSIMVVSSFFKDARLFAKPIVAAQADTVTNPGLKISDIKEESDDPKTIIYKRAADAKGDNTDYGEDIPKAKKVIDTSSGAANKVKVEVVNYTGQNNIADEIKITLQTAGFEASVVNLKATKNEKTTIVERNNKKLGIEVQKVLNAGKIIIAIDSKSKFDVTLIIGEDYKP